MNEQAMLSSHRIVVTTVIHYEMRFWATGPINSVIGGQAIAAEAILVTNNTREFAQMLGQTKPDFYSSFTSNNSSIDFVG